MVGAALDRRQRPAANRAHEGRDVSGRGLSAGIEVDVHAAGPGGTRSACGCEVRSRSAHSAEVDGYLHRILGVDENADVDTGHDHRYVDPWNQGLGLGLIRRAAGGRGYQEAELVLGRVGPDTGHRHSGAGVGDALDDRVTGQAALDRPRAGHLGYQPPAPPDAADAEDDHHDDEADDRDHVARNEWRLLNGVDRRQEGALNVAVRSLLALERVARPGRVRLVAVPQVGARIDVAADLPIRNRQSDDEGLGAEGVADGRTVEERGAGGAAAADGDVDVDRGAELAAKVLGRGLGLLHPAGVKGPGAVEDVRAAHERIDARQRAHDPALGCGLRVRRVVREELRLIGAELGLERGAHCEPAILALAGQQQAIHVPLRGQFRLVR